jgi:hypothetical protein
MTTLLLLDFVKVTATQVTAAYDLQNHAEYILPVIITVPTLTIGTQKDEMFKEKSLAYI